MGHRAVLRLDLERAVQIDGLTVAEAQQHPDVSALDGVAVHLLQCLLWVPWQGVAKEVQQQISSEAQSRN